ncbi:hypothetical protein LCGC14_1407390 [marine sediment metagenome]|uniref:Uncharacterized protein n=1 Tax=marine sediment metagenome TaxID=412755 RepID=A0A0F9MWW8_9ZZZZ
MRTYVTLNDGGTVKHDIDGSLLHCQKVVYSIHGRLNIKRVQFRVGGRWIDSPYLVNPLSAIEKGRGARLVTKLDGLGGQLYRSRFHLINSLTTAVDDCDCRLGTVDMGTEDSGRRIVDVFGLDDLRHVSVTWTTTEFGNTEATFSLI